MSVACLHGLWLGNFIRSPLRCQVAFSPSFLQERCVYPQLDIKGASICCRGRGYISTATKQGPDGWWYKLTFEQARHCERSAGVLHLGSR
jgi:hypothetical protein